MWKQTKPTYDEYYTAEVSEQEASAHAKAWEKYRGKVSMSTGTSGYFDHYSQQIYTLVPLNRDSVTEVVLPQIANKQGENEPKLTQEVTPVSEAAMWWWKYSWQNGKLVMVKAKGGLVDVATYYITIAKEIQEIEAGRVKNKYSITVTTRDRSFPYMVEQKNLYKLNSLLKVEHPECYIFPGYDDDFKTYIWLQVNDFLQLSGLTVPYKVYNLFGWYDDGGTLRFMHAGLKCSDFEVKGKLSLKRDLYKATAFYNSFCLTAPPQVTLILLLYALHAYMAGVYQRCCTDEGCRSVMYLAGVTGSGKTSLVKVLTAWTKKARLSTELRFDDTLASLQEHLVNNRDIVTLVDDFYPKATKVAKAEFQRKAEEITRIIGDGRVKGKMGADRKLIADRDYRGGIIATGEYVDLGTYSSYLRCFILNINKGDVKFDRLTVLQQSPELAEAFFSEWIYWLEENQQSLLGRLPTRQMTNLKIVSSCLQSEYARLSVSVAALMSTADCFSDFAKAIGIEFDINAAREIVLRQSQQMYNTVKVASPEQVAIDAIVEAVENGGLEILSSKDEFKQNPSADGYYEDGYKYWIVTTKVREVIKRYAESNNYSVEFTPALRKVLYQKGYLDSPNETKFSQSIPGKASRPRGYTFIIKEEENNYDQN